MKSFIAITMILFATLAIGQSGGVKVWDPNSIQWQDTYSDGTKWSVLEGDKDAPGKAFTYAFFIPAGYWEHHSHSQDARVAVLSGVLKVAVGPTLDKQGASPIRLVRSYSCLQTWNTRWVPMSTQSSSAQLWDRGKLTTMRKCTTITSILGRAG